MVETNWTLCDWHGVWVTDIVTPGSYGRIAYRCYYDDDEKHSFWVRWVRYAKGDKRESAGLHDVHSLKLLPVAPEGWFDDNASSDINFVTSDRESGQLGRRMELEGTG